MQEEKEKEKKRKKTEEEDKAPNDLTPKKDVKGGGAGGTKKPFGPTT
jgi:hypothetical protein